MKFHLGIAKPSWNFNLVYRVILVLVIAWLRVQLAINLIKGCFNFPSTLNEERFCSLSYRGSNLSLIARKTMRLLFNHQLILFVIQPKSISLKQICYKRSHGIAVTSLHCLLFSTSKYKDLKRISKNATNVVLKLKFLWTAKLVFP